MRLLTLLLSVFVVTVTSEKVRYDNYKVYRVTPKNAQQLQILIDLEATGGYSFWTDARRVNYPVDIMVPPHLHSAFEDFASSSGIMSELFIKNVQEKIERSVTRRSGTYKTMDWNDYHTLEEIYEWLDKLAFTYPDKVNVLNVGRTYEGRDIKGVHVKLSPGNANRSVFIEGGIHAREWISPATVTYILNEFLTSSNTTIQNIAHSFDWYFFPVFNPDGYVYTFKTDRMWRKTRIPYSGRILCYGADPNRNWGFHWMEGGASSNPCSDIYAGPTSFSENCTRVLSDFIATIGRNLLGYIGFHSYSQALLIPYGHTSEHLDNYDELMALGEKAVASLALRYGTIYSVGSIPEIIGIVTGSSMDWVKHSFDTRITYTYELRPSGYQGLDGFALPPEQIIPTGEETLDSLITIFQEALVSVK